jgi:N-acetylneuraminic acid mutarotase
VRRAILAAGVILAAVAAVVAPRLIPSSGAAREQGAWVDLAPLAAPRQEVAVAELGGRIYVAGGFRPDGGAADTVEAYDPSTDRWEPIAPLPLPVHHAAAAAVDGILYVIGGMTGPESRPVDSVFAYSPATGAWARRAPMPSARGAMGVAVIDGRIYAAGGDPRERDFAAYDPAADAWTPLAPMPTPRNHLAAGNLGGRFYAVGGRSGSIGGITGALEEFDPATGQWAARAPMPTPRGGIGGAELGALFYVFGGEGNRRHPLGIFDQVEAYDPAANTWRSLPPMAVPRHGIGAAASGSRIYIPGGAIVEGFGTTDVHQAFEPE